MQRVEKTIEDECCAIAWNEFGILSVKQDAKKGLPDRIFFRCKGKKRSVFFVEFKDKGRKSKKYQQHIQDQLSKSGVSVYKDVDDEDDFRKICKEETK